MSAYDILIYRPIDALTLLGRFKRRGVGLLASELCELPRDLQELDCRVQK